MNKKAKREYMRKYMRKYYKKHAAKIRARTNARNKIQRRLRRLREKTEDESPTLPTHKEQSIPFSREKIDIPPSVKPVFLGPTCPNCGMLRLDPTVLCRHCGPDARPRNHKPPSPAPQRKVRQWRSASSNPLDDESDWDRKEVRP
jgi:hypothetical protein